MFEWYSRHIFPVLSDGLARVASFFPFSLSDVFIYGSLAGLLVYLLLRVWYAPWTVLGRSVLYLLGVGLWFYAAWGVNYFREPFYGRAGVTPQPYDSVAFHAFLTRYAEKLNDSYLPEMQVDTDIVAREVKARYRQIAPRFGLKEPREYHRAKPMLSSAMMSAVGVLGYIGPFFNEATLNADLLPVQYPSTYAHEMAHVLGVAGEGEANFYAWLVCSSSPVPEIRFAGWFSLFPYVLGNAYRTLSPEEFKAWTATVRPEVKDLYNRKNAYWQARYNAWWGDLQERVYNLYLKGNRVAGGTANYSEVVGMVMAWEACSGDSR